MSKKNQTQQPEYLSAYQFAERKEVSETAVYDKIKAGIITPVQFGKRKYINWEDFKHVEFPRAKLYKPEENTQPQTN